MLGKYKSTSPSIQGVSKVRKRERIFELSLPALVQGKDARGLPFEEKTTLLTISAETASFNLAHSVTLGEVLRLKIEIPQTILLQTKLKLELAGEVTRILAASNGPTTQLQTISLKLFPQYSLQPLAEASLFPR